MKRDIVLSYLELKGECTAQDIADKFNETVESVRQAITYLRQDGHIIKTIRGRKPCSYSLEKIITKPEKENKTEEIRIILGTGDEWECSEIADMIGKSTHFVSNTIGELRRRFKVPVKTIKISRNRYSYRLVVQ